MCSRSTIIITHNLSCWPHLLQFLRYNFSFYCVKINKSLTICIVVKTFLIIVTSAQFHTEKIQAMRSTVNMKNFRMLFRDVHLRPFTQPHSQTLHLHTLVLLDNLFQCHSSPNLVGVSWSNINQLVLLKPLTKESSH